MPYRDYDALISSAPWFYRQFGAPRHLVSMDALPAPAAEFAETFPLLTRLLAVARCTGLVYDQAKFLLLGWTLAGGQGVGWVVYPPNADAAAGLHPSHRRLLSEFGGIKETWVVDRETTEFTSYLDNLNWALGELETLKGSTGEEGSNVREAAEFYEEMCADQEVDPVLDVRDYRCFAQEANGDWYLYQKQTSELLLVSHDLGFDFVEPKQPLEDTRLDLPVYRFKELNTLTEWVERVAGQWLGHIDVSSAGGT